MLWTSCSRSDDVDANKTLQDAIPLLLMIDWCSCCWAQNSSKDGIHRGLMMILMQLFFGTKLLKQAHVIIQTGECWLLEVWERRGSRILQRASGGGENNCMEKEGLRERYETTKTATKHSSKQKTAAGAKPQRQQAEETETETENKQASTSYYYYCAHILLRHKQHSHNDATTTQPRRTKRQEPQRPGRAPPPPPPSMKTTIQFVDSHSFIHHIRTFHPTAPSYPFFYPSQRDE